LTKWKKQEHTKEFKEDAVELITAQGYSAAEPTRNLVIYSTIFGRLKNIPNILNNGRRQGKYHFYIQHYV